MQVLGGQSWSRAASTACRAGVTPFCQLLAFHLAEAKIDQLTLHRMTGVMHAGLGRSELVQSCFYSLQGWWSYELCPGRQLRQFHLEEGNRPNPVINMGRYDSQACPSDHTI